MNDSLRMPLEEPVITHATERHFVGIRRDYRDQAGLTLGEVLAAIGEQAATAADRLHEITGKVDGSLVSLSFGMFSDRTGFDYLMGAEVMPGAVPDPLPEGMETVTLPPQRYLAFPHPLPADRVRGSLYTIWHEWLPGSPFTVANDGPNGPDYIERQGEDFDPETGTGTIELQIPIRE